jgi:hypothetical protein
LISFLRNKSDVASTQNINLHFVFVDRLALGGFDIECWTSETGERRSATLGTSSGDGAGFC